MQKLADLLNDPRKLCTETAASNCFDEPVDPNSPQAIRWCLVGGVMRIKQSIRPLFPICVKYGYFGAVDAARRAPWLVIQQIIKDFDDETIRLQLST